ncbi:MAG: (2Fe-2S)-binding protein [Firmicutes bacterium]|nr:(2Fe-2S)-binding protein [Bacillota bacterium]HXL03440.1 (2Fe-2S)-binding protein [Bacillota bacterium]
MLHNIEMTVNGELVKAKVPSHMRLLDFLREELDLIGAKEGCGKGECGACTVLVEGKAVNSCLMLAVEASGKEVLTVEGLSEGDSLDPIQQSIIDNSALQCGYCTPGMVMSAKGLLLRNPSPTRDEVVEAISGNLCRCTGYARVVDAIMQVAASSKSQDEGSEG